MSGCPDIDDLLAPGAVAVRAHVAACAACASVATLIAARAPRSATRASAGASCAELEPTLAAMIDGTIHRLELGRLVSHLAECGACSDLASRLTLVRSELDDVPDPRMPKAAAATALPASPATGATTVVRNPPNSSGSGRVGVGGRLRGALLPSGPTRAVWAAQLALVALGTWAVTRALRDRGPAIEAVHDGASGVEAAPGGGSDVARALERARAAEQHQKDAEERAKNAEERAKNAEERLIEAEKRIGELEPGPVDPLHPTAPRKPEPVASAPPAAEPPSSEPGFLTVVCNPFCDDVLDGGRSLGPSPIVHLAMKPGQHRIVLKRSGMPTKAISVVIVAGEVTAQRVSMSGTPTGIEY